MSNFYAPRLLYPGDSPGKNAGVGCHALLQGIFPAQGLNPGLPHCREILYHLSHPGSPSVSVCSYCFVDRNLNSLTFLSISQPFQLCRTINASWGGSLCISQLHIIQLLFYCLFYFVCLCYFMWKKHLPSSCLWVSVKKYLHKDVSLCNHPPSRTGCWFLPQSQEKYAEWIVGGNHSLFLSGCAPKLLWTKSDHRGPSEMLLDFLILIRFSLNSPL